MKTQESWTIGAAKVVLLVGFLAGMGYSLHLFSVGTLTAKESVLLGVLLTICSILASWLITHVYSASQTEAAVKDIQERNQANLRTYALKASEKVNNLSNELGKLAAYLEQELNYNGYEGPKEALSAREERIESAIHMIRTLKSVNDTSLSDWEGVIGEELEEQREEQLEKEAQIQELVERFETLAEHQRQEMAGNQENAEILRAEVQAIRAALSNTIGPSLQSKVLRRATRMDVEAKCPRCAAQLEFRQRPTEGSVKALACKNCDSKLICRYTAEKGFQLAVRVPKEESFVCPKCLQAGTAILDVVPGSLSRIICKHCASLLALTRTKAGTTIRLENPPASVISQATPLSEALISKIQSELPQQPWPTGIHKAVAKKLGVDQTTLQRAMRVLIRRGIFNPQIDGVVYQPVPRKEPLQAGSASERPPK